MANYTPALGRSELTGDYDRVIAIMTRERKWRRRMLELVNPRDGDVIIDIGSGTGTFALLMKVRAPDSRVFAVDPDPEVRAIAEAKATATGVNIRFINAMGDAKLDEPAYGSVDVVTISLVLHQCPDQAKAGILRNAFALLRPAGRLVVADYGLQPNALMRLLFNQVRSLDGYENTRANKDGRVPDMIGDVGFAHVDERAIVQTPTGAITLWVATKAPA
jgi:ubiquinone/menaquinone biosynthesis C-methylase UbiE